MRVGDGVLTLINVSVYRDQMTTFWKKYEKQLTESTKKAEREAAERRKIDVRSPLPATACC